MKQLKNINFQNIKAAYATQSVSSVSSVTQSCPTLCDPMNCSTPGLPVHHHLLEFTQTHTKNMGWGRPKMVEGYDGETTFSPTNSSKEHLNTVNSTKQLLNAGRGHQAPRTAAHCLQKEVGKNIKDKKRDKRGRDGYPSQEGSLKKERFPNTRKHSHWRVCGEP